jgi:hypothetical protein
MNEELVKMWNRVKGDNLSTGMVVIVSVILLIIIAYIVYSLVSRNKNSRKRRK